MWISWGSSYLNYLGFLDLDVCFFPRLGKFPTIITSNKFSAFFSLFSSLWEPYDMNVNLFGIGSVINLLSCLYIFFFLSIVLLWLDNFHILVQIDWSFLVLYLVCCWTPSVYFFQFSHYILQLCNFYLILSYIFHLFAEVLTSFIHSSSQFSIFMTLILNSLLGKLFTSVSLWFSGVLSCSFIWNKCSREHLEMFLHFAWFFVFASIL